MMYSNQNNGRVAGLVDIIVFIEKWVASKYVKYVKIR
jgi:hypothetical protein